MAGKDERLVKLSADEAKRLIALYTQAEAELQRLINDMLLRGNNVRYLQQVKANIDSILGQLRQGNRDWSSQAIVTVYDEATKGIDQRVLNPNGSGPLEPIGSIGYGFGAVHEQAVNILAENTFKLLDHVVVFIGRQTDDIYRSLALEAVRGTAIGYETWKQVADRYKERLLEKGVTGFTDKAGRDWNMTTYSEMVSRTTTMEAHLEGTKNRLLERGRDLVKISRHGRSNEPCKLCAPWEGKIVSLTGRTPGYPTLDDAKVAGLFHPNCEHAYSLYLPEWDQL